MRILEQPPGSLTTLALSGLVSEAKDVVTLLLASGHLPFVKNLDLSGTAIGTEGLTELLSSPDCRGLETLRLGGAPLPEGVYRHGKPWAGQLTCELDDGALTALTQSPHLAQLKVLDLSCLVAQAETWERFAASPLARQLTHFGAFGIPEASTSALSMLVAAASHLEGLGLGLSAFGDGGVGALLQSKARSTIKRLQLDFSKLTFSGAHALLEADLPSLELLHLKGLAVDQALIDALNERRGTRALRTVVLDEKTVLPTGQPDVWSDQGCVVGESPGFFWLYQLPRSTFERAALKVTPVEIPWPRGWIR